MVDFGVLVIGIYEGGVGSVDRAARDASAVEWSVVARQGHYFHRVWHHGF